MLISLDKEKCLKCGVCSARMKGYCISAEDGFPIFNDILCNTCQKCVAICPSQAIMVNGIYPQKITDESILDPQMILSMLEKRRSIKKYSDKEIPREIIEKIISVAKYAPNQNKNI
jgi:MinD superfamily P-loop ATPase